MATLEALQAKIKKLQAQAEAIASKKSTAALEGIRESATDDRADPSHRFGD